MTDSKPSRTPAGRAITFRSAYDRYKRRNSDKPRTREAYYDAIRKWERLTGDAAIPLPAGTGDDRFRLDYAGFKARMAEFQEQLLAEIEATTVNKACRALNAVLARLGPETTGNPDGVELLPKVPRFRRLREDPQPPRPLSDDQVSACYRAADFANWPRVETSGVLPGDWWRALLVFLWNLGLRTGDFCELRWNQVDFEHGEIGFKAEKTSKRAAKPMHPVLAEHLKRLFVQRANNRRNGGVTSRRSAGRSATKWAEHVFPTPNRKKKLMATWQTIQRWAGVRPDQYPATRPSYFLLKDLRATCGTAYYAVSPGVAQKMLDHSSADTTHRFYAPRIDPRVVKQVLALEQPAAFLDGDDRPPLGIVG